MPDIKFVVAKPAQELEDDVQYEKFVLKMKREVAKGKTFAQACEILKDTEKHLRPLLQDDFLKIIIAEQHFGQGRGLDDVALFLDLPYETVEASRATIMSDFDEILSGNTSSNTINISKLTH